MLNSAKEEGHCFRNKYVCTITTMAKLSYKAKSLNILYRNVEIAMVRSNTIVCTKKHSEQFVFVTHL